MRCFSAGRKKRFVYDRAKMAFVLIIFVKSNKITLI